MAAVLVTVVGNMVTDVEFAVSDSGKKRARFRVATNDSWYDQERKSWVNGPASYFQVTCWERVAENASNCLGKGMPVVISGELRQREVVRPVPGESGEPGATYRSVFSDLVGRHLGLDLSRCRARFERAPLGPQVPPRAAEAQREGARASPGSVPVEPRSEAAAA